MATIYRTDGTTQEVQPENGKDFSLKEVQTIVGGYVEVVRLRDKKKIMIINEEGRLIDLPPNEQATKIAELATEEEWAAFKKRCEAEGTFVVDARLPGPAYIAGDVLVCLSREFR